MVKQQGKDDIHLEVIYIITGKMWDQAGSGILSFYDQKRQSGGW